jgi:hypothetical protein
LFVGDGQTVVNSQGSVVVVGWQAETVLAQRTAWGVSDDFTLVPELVGPVNVDVPEKLVPGVPPPDPPSVIVTVNGADAVVTYPEDVKFLFAPTVAPLITPMLTPTVLLQPPVAPILIPPVVRAHTVIVPDAARFVCWLNVIVSLSPLVSVPGVRGADASVQAIDFATRPSCTDLTADAVHDVAEVLTSW